jgi:hypothetical protein
VGSGGLDHGNLPAGVVLWHVVSLLFVIISLLFVLWHLAAAHLACTHLTFTDLTFTDNDRSG